MEKKELRKDDAIMAVRKIVRPFETTAFVLLIFSIFGLFASLIVGAWYDWLIAAKIFFTSAVSCSAFAIALSVIQKIEKHTIDKIKEMVK